MKRVLQYKSTDEGYGCFENDECVFLVKKDDLKFDVKEFYQAFYAEGKDFDDISIVNEASDDNKEAGRVYQCIITLVEQINEKLKELEKESEEQGALNSSNEDEEI